MHRNRIAVFTAVAMVLSGCGPKLDEIVIPQNSALWEAALAPVLAKLSEDEKTSLSAYLSRARNDRFGGPSSSDVPPLTTVAAALKEQRAWEQRQAQLKADRERAQHELENTLSAKVIDKAVLPRKVFLSGPGARWVDIELRNTGSKDIVAVSAEILFRQPLTGYDADVALRQAVDLKAGTTQTLRLTVTTRASDNDEYEFFWPLQKGEYAAQVRLDAAVFADGTRLPPLKR